MNNNDTFDCLRQFCQSCVDVLYAHISDIS